MTKKQLNRKLIKLQNQYGKKLGRSAWQEWVKSLAKDANIIS